MDEHDRIAQPRIDPSRTPFTETAAFRRYGFLGDPDPGSAEALYTKALIREQGFDGLPHVVPREALIAYIVGGEVELFRGVSAARFAHELRYGDFFIGRGGELGGMYTAAGPHALVVARQYASLGDGTVVRMALKAEARLVRWHELEARVSALQHSAELPGDVASMLYHDPGMFAAYLGYDAVHIVDFPDVDNYVVVNRTALRVQKEDTR